jgi:hypothetical protein
MFGIYLLNFYHCVHIFIQVENFNPIFFLPHWRFCNMFMAVEHSIIYKKIQYDAKNEPPYLATIYQICLLSRVNRIIMV